MLELTAEEEGKLPLIVQAIRAYQKNKRGIENGRRTETKLSRKGL